MSLPVQQTPGLRERHRSSLSQAIGSREERKIEARRQRSFTLWYGFGMLGLVGWSVALPTLAGIGLGVWLDRRYPQSFSWTLTFLGLGVTVGCLNATYWVRKELKRPWTSEDRNDAEK